MKKKLQVFISSTYTDMIEERQAAVLAVLNAGHIPAGMELFKSGDQSQKVTIMRWIQESDVYMLILGGRYGSMDDETDKSYTHWEYDYAGELGKRRFAIVIDDKRLNEKARENPDYMERINYKKYLDFKGEVLGNISKFYEDIKDIKLITMESLKEYELDDSLVGWMKADQVGSVEETLRENSALLKENIVLKTQIENVNKEQSRKVLISGWEYEELKVTLINIKIKLPEILSDNEEEVNLLQFFSYYSDKFNIGVTNSAGNSDKSVNYVFHRIAPKLLPFGLLEKVKVAGVQYQRIQTSKEGLKFLAELQMEDVNRSQQLPAKKNKIKKS